MAWHIYIVPRIGSGTSVADPRGPKYALGSGFQYACAYYGRQPWVIVAADVPDATDTQVSGQADVIKIPDNLDSTLTAGAVTTVQGLLEARDIPAQWVTQGMSYRTLLRIIIGMCHLLRRFSGIRKETLPLVTVTTNLDTRFNQLPAQVRTDLLATGQSLQIDTSSMSGTSTIREILFQVGQQFAQHRATLGGLVI